MANMSEQRRVPCIPVKQWLSQWTTVDYDPEHLRRKPLKNFYVLSLPASELLALSGIQRRVADPAKPRAEDTGIQRIHDKKRSQEIAEFVRFGYPWSDLSPRQRNSDRFTNLRKPGWLPTAIVVNVLTADNIRWGKSVAVDDLIHVKTEPNGSFLELPTGFSAEWNARDLEPIEVIDGQHRLWAFEEESLPSDYELPVVAFVGLDISWQAYLFWTINIKPKKINTSLAFDLYPLLRTEDWLNHVSLRVYRETRAQELTEALWSNPKSPWHGRINMLGERGKGGVTQAAWVRSLVSTLIRPSQGPGVKVGGLFGAPVGDEQLALGWTRNQQAAFLIYFWRELRNGIEKQKPSWSSALLRDTGSEEDLVTVAFEGPFTLLNTDQGVRAALFALNDLNYVRASELKLHQWVTDSAAEAIDEAAVEDALASLAKQRFAKEIQGLARSLANWDWRTSGAPRLTEKQRLAKAAFRGSGGYRELRIQIFRHVEKQGTAPYQRAASEVLARLGEG